MNLQEKNLADSPVLIDTPVWQNYFRKQERTFREVNALMDAGRVCCLDLVVAELLHTAQTEEEMKVYQDFTRIFPVLPETAGAWVDAALLAFKVHQKGADMPLRDCYLAVVARAHRVLLFTTNKKMRQAGRALGLQFFTKRRPAE